jgi:peptidyl-prolyl cis-trans isomerase A (cyclophilin A)
MRFGALLLTLILAIHTQAGTLAQFRTIFGDIEVELYDQDKPITVQNFIRYVRSGLYQDGIIHRCDPTFVIQGGGIYVAQRGATNQGLASVPVFPPIPNEYGAGMTYSNRYGTIAMAKAAGDTNSARSQWFFNLTNNFSLDAHNSNSFFTVFGHIVRGTNVLNVFKTFSRSTSVTTNVIRDLSPLFGPSFGELPALTSALRFQDLLYVDISLLNVQVTQTESAREISWNSVKDKTNRVEFTTNFPPSWQTLTATNGTGFQMKVSDAGASETQRFYRVRVDY